MATILNNLANNLEARMLEKLILDTMPTFTYPIGPFNFTWTIARSEEQPYVYFIHTTGTVHGQQMPVELHGTYGTMIEALREIMALRERWK